MLPLPKSLWGRLVLLFLGVLLIAQFMSAALHFRDRGEALKHATGFNAAQQIAGLVHVLDPLDEGERKRIVDALDLEPLRLRLDEPPSIDESAAQPTTRERVFHRLVHLHLGAERQILVDMRESLPVDESVRPWGPPAGLRHHAMPGRMKHHMAMMAEATSPRLSFLVHVQLQGGQWASFAYFLPEELAAWPWDLLVGLIILLVAVLAVSFFAVHWLVRPLGTLASAAEALGKDIDHAPVEETGSVEMQRAARAFNTMQRRLSRFVDERTRILAAVSHDLKTPITRMRLRVESIDDDQLRAKFEHDLGDMQTLVESSLDFMRGMALREETQRIDMDALLESLRDDAQDMGHAVEIVGEAIEPYEGKPTALKRCLGNLIDNAVRYAGSATLEIMDSESELVILVLDTGPGLPEESLVQVFEPFYRLESSRSQKTGGTGLGLSIARNIARGHGGELRLRNRSDTLGLEAIVSLPR